MAKVRDRLLTRRQVLRRLVPAGLLALAAGCGAGYSFTIEPGWLALERVEARFAALPGALHGLRIAQLSSS